MEKFTSPSVKVEEKNDIVCYGVAWSKAEGSTKDETCKDTKFQNTDEVIKSDTSFSLPKRNSLDAKELKMEIVSNTQSNTTGNEEFKSRKSPRKLQPIMREVERLEMQKETLEDKVQVLKEKITKGRYKRNKGSYLLQIKNAEKKIEMLEKRIAYEMRTTNVSSGWKGVQTLKKSSDSLYVNSLRSDDILARKMRAKLVLKGEGKEGENLEQETLDKKERSLNKWESRWKELVLKEDSDEEMEIYGFVIKKSKRKTVFYPPIPDPMAKKRPKELMPLKERRTVKQGESDSYNDNSRERIRLVPNRKRVLLKRAKVYKKQLEFADKHGLEKEDIIDNLNSYHQQLSDEELAPSVTKQQLHLIGALSEDHLSP